MTIIIAEKSQCSKELLQVQFYETEKQALTTTEYDCRTKENIVVVLHENMYIQSTPAIKRKKEQ